MDREPYVVSWLCEGNRFWTTYRTQADAAARMAELRSDPYVSDVILEFDN